MASNVDGALKLAKAGFYVFPCRGKHPACKGDWNKVSTRDETKIRAMWRNKSGLVAAIDLRKSGHIVMDCDVKGAHNGKEAFEQLCDTQGLDRAKVPVVATPSGGIHYYFRQRAGEARGDNKGALPKGIDVKGKGYVIAPMMRMVDGGEYEYSGDINALAHAPTLPDWLADVLGEYREKEETGEKAGLPVYVPSPPLTNGRHAKAYIKSAFEGELGKLSGAQQGDRNDTLFLVSLKIASMASAGWVSKDEVIDQLFVMGVEKGLKQNETRRAIRNGFKIGINNPRRLPDDVLHADEEENITPQEEKLRAEISNVIYLSLERKKRAREGTRAVIEGEGGESYYEDTGEIVDMVPAPAHAPAPVEFEFPQGLVGEIARWIVATARYPQPELSLGAALGLVGTVAGRQFAGPTFSGTHLYILAMAETGTGKDAPLQAIKTILNAAGMGMHIGPDEFASMSAVAHFLQEKPLSICPMDEFGSFMMRVNATKASSHEKGIAKILRSMWSSSFSSYITSKGIGRDSVTLHSPAISLYGATTPGQFYSSMTGSHLEDGTLNRFLLLRGRDWQEEVEPQQEARKVPQWLIEGLKKIYNASGETAALWRNDPQADPTKEDRVIKLVWCADGAEKHYKDFVREIAQLRKQHIQAKEFYVRTAEMALRIATIIAIGCGRDRIRFEDLDYGIKIARASAEFMIEGAADYMAENDNQARVQKIKRFLKAHGGRMKRSELVHALNGSIKTRDVQDLIRGLVEAEEIEIQEIKQNGAGRPAICYQLRR